MTRTDDILHAAARIDDPTIDQAMADALPTANPNDAKLLTELLLQRSDPQANLALVLHYHRLPDDAQQQMVRSANDLFRPLREACALSTERGPVNALQIISQSQTTRLAYLVAERLRHGSQAVRAQAGRCLLEMTRRCLATVPMDAQSATDLTTAIHDSVRLFGHHHQTDVLLALCTLLPRDMSPSLAVLADPDAPAVGPMRRMLARADHPVVRRATLALLAIPTLTQSALSGLRHAVQAGTLGEALTHHELLATADAQHALAHVSDSASFCPSPADGDRLSQAHQLGIVALLRALPTHDATSLTLLEKLGQSPEPAVRLSVLRTWLSLASAMPAGQIHERIAPFITDSQEPLARLAVRHLLRHDKDGLPGRIAMLVNSPHPSVRQLAGHKIGPIAFERFWSQWPNLDTARRLAAGRALIKIDADFHRLLADRLLIDDPSRRQRALSIIFTLNQGSFFESALIQLTHDRDSRIVSSAVKTLGTAASSRAYRMLQTMLDHGDARVRANAVEALAQFDTHLHADRLADMAAHDDNRPRANAIAALMDLEHDRAMGSLTQMLRDAKPRHRTSALWLVETLGLIQTAGHVAEMSISDPDHTVKDRASRVIQELLSLMVNPAPSDASASGYETLTYE